MTTVFSNEESKGTRGMPWRLVPKKDVVHCEKLWSGVCTREQPEMSEWGNPIRVMPGHAEKRGNRAN